MGLTGSRGLTPSAGRRENQRVRRFRVRVAAVDDAPAMGRVMVESFLSAHRGQMPGEAFQKRVIEWTPDVSAAGWARALAHITDGNPDRDVVLVAEGDGGVLGLVSGGAADGGSVPGATCEIGALYVHSQHRGQGIGGALMRAAAGRLADLGYRELHVGVLSANHPARAFYEAMGGREIGQGTDDEEGYLLPLTIYGWAHVTDVASDRADTSSSTERIRGD
jgi:GNAT superfamily N-acetyltransferase